MALQKILTHPGSGVSGNHVRASDFKLSPSRKIATCHFELFLNAEKAAGKFPSGNPLPPVHPQAGKLTLSGATFDKYFGKASKYANMHPLAVCYIAAKAEPDSVVSDFNVVDPMTGKLTDGAFQGAADILEPGQSLPPA